METERNGLSQGSPEKSRRFGIRKTEDNRSRCASSYRSNVGRHNADLCRLAIPLLVGAFGVVWLVKERSSGQLFAMKQVGYLYSVSSSFLQC